MKSEQFYGIFWPSFFILDFQKQVHKKSHQDSDTQGMYKNRVEKDKKFLLQIPALSYFQWGNSVANGILNFPNLDFLIHNIFCFSLPSFYTCRCCKKTKISREHESLDSQYWFPLNYKHLHIFCYFSPQIDTTYIQKLILDIFPQNRSIIYLHIFI